MKRRDFIKGLMALPTAALAVPVPTSAASHFGSHIHSKEWICDAFREVESFWWDVRFLHRPTGVRYGWRVSEEHLVNRDQSIEDFMREQRGRVNPYYAS